MNKRIKTYLDRYPAKMVSHLADRIVERYCGGDFSVMDPFCGSGAVLRAAAEAGADKVCGVDINPLSFLFSKVKIFGFNYHESLALFDVIEAGAMAAPPYMVNLENKMLWFTVGTIRKYEGLRGSIRNSGLIGHDSIIPILLAMMLSVRLCSRCDQRSPKPFISKNAIQDRKGKHFDPFETIRRILYDLSGLYGDGNFFRGQFAFKFNDARNPEELIQLGKFSHVITSPPYINAQDYFRNFKLELYLLEGVMPFSVNAIKERFIGTERGFLLHGVPGSFVSEIEALCPLVISLGHVSKRFHAVVVRYFWDMLMVFRSVKGALAIGGTFVLVCGDNLIAGVHLRTWEVLTKMLELIGFTVFDTFSDRIRDRMLPPRRNGHSGLIKEEVVIAFRYSGGDDQFSVCDAVSES